LKNKDSLIKEHGDDTFLAIVKRGEEYSVLMSDNNKKRLIQQMANVKDECNPYS
jgi:hypothetical protein